MATLRDDPYAAFNFTVTVEGISDGAGVHAGFAEASGLGFEIETMEYRTGAEDIGARKLPGLKKFTNVTLRRGITGDLRFWEWAKSGLEGAVQRAQVTITLLDEKREPVQRFRLRRAWVCKYGGPDLSARSSSVAIESLELCHEGLDVD